MQCWTPGLELVGQGSAPRSATMVEWPWESCFLSVTIVNLALRTLRSLPALTLRALVVSPTRRPQTWLADVVFSFALT